MNYGLIPSYLVMIDSSLFSVVHNRDSSAAEFNNDLAKISHWAQQCKMSFNPDPSKQSQKVTFSRNVNMDSHTLLPPPRPLTFNNSIIYQSMSQRHLGIILDNHLSRPVCSKKNSTVCLLCKPQCPFPRSALLPI